MKTLIPGRWTVPRSLVQTMFTQYFLNVLQYFLSISLNKIMKMLYFKDCPDPTGSIFEIIVGKTLIRHRTTLDIE